MRLFVVVLALAGIALPVSAEPSEEARHLADLLIDRISGRDPAFRYSSYEDEDPKIRLMRMPGAVEAVLETPLRESLSQATLEILSREIQPLLRARPIEAIVPLRKVLNSARSLHVEFGLRSVQDADLVTDMAGDLIPLFERRDAAGALAAALFSGCRDADILQKLEKAATGRGIAAERALVALSTTGSSTMLPFMRRVAEDRHEAPCRRVTAISCLDPGLHDDVPILLDAMNDDDEFVMLEATRRMTEIGPVDVEFGVIGLVLTALSRNDDVSETRITAAFQTWTGARPAEQHRLFQACLDRASSDRVAPGVRRGCLSILGRLAGEDFGTGDDAPAKWSEWWRTHSIPAERK